MATKTQTASYKLPHHGRDREIYMAIKATNQAGITRQELVLTSGYEINQVSSAVSNLFQEGLLEVCGQRTNPDTDCKNDIVRVPASGFAEPPKSRRGELATLRKRVAYLEEINSKAIHMLRGYVSKYGKPTW